jgi:hypothetical protein
MIPVLNLPPASLRPRGSTTIGVTMDERSDLRDGVLLIALGSLLIGLAGGYVVGRRHDQRRNR